MSGDTTPPGVDSPRSGRPVRTCVGCRQRASSDDLVRVVVADGALVVDLRGRRPGRGAWLHPDPDCLARALARRAFPRALRVPGALDASGLVPFVQHRSEKDMSDR